MQDILDEAVYCHVAAVRDGAPVVIPMMHARDGHRLLLHGSAAAGVFRDARHGSPVCATVTLFDGLVLARSARKHSMNYRSVVVHGVPVEITDPQAKHAALRVLVEHAVPGRWEHARPPSDDELRETGVWVLGLEHASAKIRAGPPLDAAPDNELPVWAGHVPARTELHEPIPAPDLPVGIELPEHVRHLAVSSGSL